MSEETNNNVCRFRINQSECNILGTIRASTFMIMEKECLNTCEGAQGDEHIVAWLEKRMRVEYEIVKQIVEEDICTIIRHGGAVNLLHTKEFLIRKEPLIQETVELEMPGMIEKASNLMGTGIAIVGKLLVDSKDNGLWAGLLGVRACKKQIELREIECNRCPHREIVNNKERCLSFKGGEKGCGCFLADKRKWAASRCIGRVCGKLQCRNKGRWDKIDSRFGKKK